MTAAIQKLRRVATMAPEELRHRVREKLYTELDRIRLGEGKPAQSLGFNFKEYISGAPARRFYLGIREQNALLMRATFPQFVTRAVEEAERLCRHEVELLGYGRVKLGTAIDWHCDPVTGTCWERNYWADYDPVHDSLGRDTKIIHELNRHQHLPRLAKAYFLTGEERYAREAVAQLIGWIEQNPPGMGINWQSSLEIGIRSISWLWTVFLLMHSPALDEASAQRIGDSLFAQLDHVHRYTSLYSSPNTHLVGEATALFIAGLVFRHQNPASVWLHDGAALLAQEIKKQVGSDGVYGELSSYYHCYALDFYLQALTIASQNQLRLSRQVRNGIADMLQFLMHLARPDGTIPLLGDDDGGRALALVQTNYQSFQDALCSGAILYQREDFKHQAGEFAEEALWLLGADAWESYQQLSAARPESTSGYFPSAGYWIQRSGWDPGASHLVFDCGGLGILSGGHAHADALSVTLYGDGRELLVDPGTFVYNGSPEWRNYFRSTAAHNTVRVDGRDQAEQGGTVRWNGRWISRVTGEYSLPGIEYVEGEHDAYAQQAHGIVHRRRVLHIPPHYWVLADDFAGEGQHTLDFHYHFAPDIALCGLDDDKQGFLLHTDRNDLRMGLFTAPILAAIEICGGEAQSSICGWASRRYGEIEPCSVLRATMNVAPPAGALTFLEPKPAASSTLTRLNLDIGSGIACLHEGDGHEDVIALSLGDGPISVRDFAMQGEFFWLRLEDGVLKKALAIRATSLHHGGKTYFHRPKPGPYYAVFDTATKDQPICVESAEL